MNQKNSAHRHLRQIWCCCHSGSPKPICSALENKEINSYQCLSFATSLGIIWDQPSDQNVVYCIVLVSYCCIMPSHILQVQQLRGSRTFISSVPLICRTHLTSPVTTISLNHSRRLLMEWFSHLMEMCKRNCMSGYTSSQKIFSRGIQVLVKHYRKCTECYGNCVEKWQM
jgi:hypothetical protein